MSAAAGESLADANDRLPPKRNALIPSGNPAMFWAMAYKVSDVFMALMEAGAIADLARTPATANALAERHRWHVTPLTQYLDLLVLTGVLTSSDGLYRVPSETAATLPVVAMEAQVRRWHAANRSLCNVLRTGRGAEPLTRIVDSTFLDSYQRAMAASARALALHIYRYAGLPVDGLIVDIGGADGALVEHLSTFVPRAHFCVVDREPVQPYFDTRMAAGPATERFRFVADDATSPGPMIDEIKKADAVLISNVIHLLKANEIRDLIDLLRTMLRPGARLVVYDQFIDSGQFSAADLMTIDWAYLGTAFRMTDRDMASLWEDYGFIHVGQHRSPLLPGALVWASAP